MRNMALREHVLALHRQNNATGLCHGNFTPVYDDLPA
jgi:hypothetical protein